MNPKNYVVRIANGRKYTKRRPELCNLTKTQRLKLQEKERQ